MRHRNSSRLGLTTAVVAVLGGLWVWPAVSSAQLPPLPVGTLLGTTVTYSDAVVSASAVVPRKPKPIPGIDLPAPAARMLE